MLGADWQAPAVRAWTADAAAEARGRALSQRAAAAGRIVVRAER